MNKKGVIAVFVLVFFLTSTAMPFFSSSASVVFNTGTTANYTFDSYDINDSSLRAMGVTVSVTAFEPTLLNFETTYNQDGATLRFKNSSGNNFNGTITQNGTAYNTEGSSTVNFNVTYSGSGTTQKISSISGSEIASGSGSITGLSFSGLPTSLSWSGGSLSSMYLYEEKYDVSVRLRNYMGSVYQFNYTTAQQNLALDVSHITGTLVGGDIEQIDGFGELSCYRIHQSSNTTQLGLTASSDYIYSNRITLAPGQFLTAHFIVSCYVLRTATTTAIPTINSCTYNGYADCRSYDGVNPSVLWNLYYINQKLDHMLTAPSNSSSLTNQSASTQSDISSQHSSEQSYFNQNEQALQATGISNFQFDNNVSSGLSGITSDFALLWRAIGDWKLIYLFTLLIALATFILRHRSAIGGRAKGRKSDD